MAGLNTSGFMNNAPTMTPGEVVLWEQRVESDRLFIHFSATDGRYDATSLARSIRRLRAARGLSQEELAKATGVTRRSIFNYEAGMRVSTLDRAFALAKALGVDINAFDFTKPVSA